METKSALTKLFHLIAILHYAWAIFYDVVHVFPEEVKIRKFSFGGKFIYLTFNNTVCVRKFPLGFKVQVFVDFLDSSTDLFRRLFAERFHWLK